MGLIKSKPTTLAQKDLDFLLSHTNYDTKAIKVQFESFMKDCPNGHLTPDIGSIDLLSHFTKVKCYSWT